MNDHTTKTILPCDGVPRFFAAANTANGFYDGFGELLAHYAPTRLFILKGGPGVGKSTLMKRAASLAAGRGMEAHLFHCSSDPSSLDAVFLPQCGIGIVDGTPPHTVEPRLAGCTDEIVDLGEAWDMAALSEKRERIGQLAAQKGDAYHAAYQSLAAAGALTDEVRTFAARCIDREKMTAAVERLAARCAMTKGRHAPYLPPHLFALSRGTMGEVRSFSPEDLTKKHIFVTDVHRTAALFFGTFSELAKKKGIRMSVMRDVTEPAACAGVYLPDASLSVTLYDETLVRRATAAGEEVRIVNMNRFFDAPQYREHRTLCRFCEKTAAELIENALTSLHTAGNAHAALEEIYGAATDYDAVHRIGEKRVLSVIAAA